ncbi:response regulator transcription factor [Cellulomonas sp. McL0617]|uniref:response regulator transcription factor n=1 Tax=Cellulomonas sp. McL0617 TaxID=3415675 RepID=UPI003CF5CA7F
MSTVMVVDDEERIRTLVSRSLASAGHDVVSAADGFRALDRLAAEDIDLVLLDLVMPSCNGLTVLAAMRQREDPTPVIVLTGVTDVSTRVRALDHGAVDVVAKPFSLVELLARTRRHLGPTTVTRTETRFVRAGGIRLDLERRRVTLADHEVSLTEREFALLAHLMRRHGEVCTRGELVHDVWGLDFDPGSNVVEVCMRRLRNKLQPDPPIETIRRVGYCFSAE